MTDFELCSDYLDWELGVHGIYVEFVNPALNLENGDSATTNGTTTTSDHNDNASTPGSKTKYRSLTELPKLRVRASRAENPRGLATTLHATFQDGRGRCRDAQGWVPRDRHGRDEEEGEGESVPEP